MKSEINRTVIIVLDLSSSTWYWVPQCFPSCDSSKKRDLFCYGLKFVQQKTLCSNDCNNFERKEKLESWEFKAENFNLCVGAVYNPFYLGGVNFWVASMALYILLIWKLINYSKYRQQEMSSTRLILLKPTLYLFLFLFEMVLKVRFKLI